MSDFIGRNSELCRLQRLFRLDKASLVVVKGRRRIGKSRLLRQFAKGQRSYFFQGIPPNEATTAQKERDLFKEQFERLFNTRGIAANNWGDLFWQLAEKTKKGRVIIVLDEITWMGEHDKNFLGELKNAWDLYFCKNPQLLLILCGSLSAWIEDNILSSTGFLGRESLTINLTELPLKRCNEFLVRKKIKTTLHEKLKLFSITGGVPRYLEEIDPKLSTDENIREMCFSEGGILFNEFEKIFTDLFKKKNLKYKQIVAELINGAKPQKELAAILGYESQSEISKHLNILVKSNFITRDYTWQIHSGKISKLSRYRLSDNYTRFYLKYILPNKERARQGNLAEISPATLPGWHTIMGLQVENLIINNRKKLKQLLNIKKNETLIDNPFLQRKTNRHPGCQIDYMIQTKFNILYICEFKFKTQPIGKTVINDLKQKIDNLALPRNFTYRPVLVHASSITDDVLESQFFSDIIHLEEFFE